MSVAIRQTSVTERDQAIRLHSTGGTKAAFESAIGSWVLPALAVDAFRVAAGILLAWHFLEHARFTPPMLRMLTDSSAGLGSNFAILSMLRRSLTMAWLRGCCGLGIVLSVLLVLGPWSRACALALLAISAVTYAFVQPFVTLDDGFAGALSFWLALLPPTGALRLTRCSPWRARDRENLSGYAVAGCGVFFLLFLMHVRLGEEGLSPVTRLAVFAAAAWAVAPVGGARWLAPALAVGVLLMGHPFQRAVLTSGASLALCAMLLTAAIARRPSGSPSSHVPSFGGADLIGGCAVVLFSIHIFAAHAGAQAIVRSTGAVLAAAGMPVPWTTIDWHLPTATLDIGFGMEGTPVRGENLDPNNPRLQSMLHVLEASSPMTDSLRAPLIQRLVDLRCKDADADASSKTAVEDVLLLRNGHVASPIARFQCVSRDGHGTLAAQSQ